MAAWNNQATNAGNASALYLNAMLDLSGAKGHGGAKELVLTVPPSKSNYYVVALLDGYINAVGSIGTRTTPSTHAQTYLLVGPTSRYAHQRMARIHGFTYRVMPFDTNRGWMLIRIRADSLVPASDPTSIASIQKSVVERFGLSTLAEFERRGHQPKYFQPGQYTPTPEQTKRAIKWHTAPTNAVAFFKQVGQALRLNPLPTASTGLNGIPLRTLPSWIVPQARANRRYRNPSYPQRQHAGPVQAPRPHRERVQDPAQLGPRTDRRAPGRLGGRARRTSTTSSPRLASPKPPITGAISTAGSGIIPTRPRDTSTEPRSPSTAGPTCRKTRSTPRSTTSMARRPPQLDRNNTYKLTFTPPVTNPTTCRWSVPCRRP